MIPLDSSSSSDNQIPYCRKWKKRVLCKCRRVSSSDNSESESPKLLKCANPSSLLKKNLKASSDESDGSDVSKPEEAKHVSSDSEDQPKSKIRSKKRSLPSDSDDSGKAKKSKKCKSYSSDSEDNEKGRKSHIAQDMKSKVNNKIKGNLKCSSDSQWLDFCDIDSNEMAYKDQYSIKEKKNSDKKIKQVRMHD